ncbi:unnamed protein product [Caretta caretta]
MDTGSTPRSSPAFPARTRFLLPAFALGKCCSKPQTGLGIRDQLTCLEPTEAPAPPELWWERREARQTLTVHSSWVHSRPKVLQDDRNMVCMDVVPSIPWDSKGRLHKSQRHLAFSVYINI